MVQLSHADEKEEVMDETRALSIASSSVMWNEPERILILGVEARQGDASVSPAQHKK